MLHKTQNFAPFDPKFWYNVRKINKDNLPYVFSVVFCDFNAFSVAWNWHPRLKTTENATKTQNTTLKIYGKLSRFTFLTLYQHLGSKKCTILCFMKHFYWSSVRVTKYSKCMGSHVALDIPLPRTVRMVCLWYKRHEWSEILYQTIIQICSSTKR